MLSLVGGLLGLALGVLASGAIAHVTGWAAAISPAMVLIALGFSGAVGVFFGYYPARRAAALDPIQALRYE